MLLRIPESISSFTFCQKVPLKAQLREVMILVLPWNDCFFPLGEKKNTFQTSRVDLWVFCMSLSSLQYEADAISNGSAIVVIMLSVFHLLKEYLEMKSRVRN